MSNTSTNWEDVYRVQRDRIDELEAENAALRAALVEFRNACSDAFFLPVPNVKPYYALVKKHAAFLPSSKPKKAKR